MRKLAVKCKHEDKHELIVNKARKVENELILRSAVLISTCVKCNRETSEYCTGGIITVGNELLK
jgi:hypothetical protein